MAVARFCVEGGAHGANNAPSALINQQEVIGAPSLSYRLRMITEATPFEKPGTWISSYLNFNVKILRLLRLIKLILMLQFFAF